ncbi:MAG: carboxylate-amine ligase [Solirubrobacteraceae bacterium]
MPGSSSADGLSAAAFGNERPFSVGIEEELFLVDPLSGALINSSSAVVERVAETVGGIERELHACQVELISPVCRTTAEATATLARMRRAVLDTGAGVLGAGTHPSASEVSAEITDRERYERIRELLGDAALTPVGGLHVHVGMASARAAVRAYNGLREHLPLLQALSANSPFRHGRDTGLASAREVTLRGWPRSGVPRALESFDDFRALAALMTRAANVPDYTWFWWKLRPHPRLGTVEVRSLDAQAQLRDTAALAALVHCLAHHHAERDLSSTSPPEVIEEALFRAARFGARAELPDAQGALRPVAEVLERTLALCADSAAELGCTAELATLRALAADGGGAGRQRAIYEVAGMASLLRALVEITAGSDRPTAPQDR